MLKVAGAAAALLLLIPLGAHVSRSIATVLGLIILVGWVLLLLRYLSYPTNTCIGRAPDAASLFTIEQSGMASGTIRSLRVVFTVVCRSGWIPILTRS
jgi:hypothetical protein